MSASRLAAGIVFGAQRSRRERLEGAENKRRRREPSFNLHVFPARRNLLQRWGAQRGMAKLFGKNETLVLDA